MDSDKLIEQIKRKEDNTDNLARVVAEDPLLIADLLENVTSGESSLRFKSTKILRTLSAGNPAALYPHFDYFVKLLDNSNNILKWNAIDILANLTGVDTANKFDPVFPKYYGLLAEGSLITAAHVVESSPTIIHHKPDWQTDITRALLSVEGIPLPTEECRNILRGKVILAFNQYADRSRHKKEMLDFARQQTNNTRSATRKKAEQFVMKFAPSSKILHK